MKVVCINNTELGKDSYGNPRHKKLSLTIGQTYEVVPSPATPPNSDSGPMDLLTLGESNFYMLEKDDDGVEIAIYPAHCFVTIEEYRNQQLDKIL